MVYAQAQQQCCQIHHKNYWNIILSTKLSNYNNIRKKDVIVLFGIHLIRSAYQVGLGSGIQGILSTCLQSRRHLRYLMQHVSYCLRLTLARRMFEKSGLHTHVTAVRIFEPHLLLEGNISNY